MKWSSAVSDQPSLDAAVSECLDAIRDDLGDETPDLALAFVSAHHSTSYSRVPELVQRGLGDALLIGCSGGGVIGAGREVENRPGVAITAARLPDVELTPFHIESDDLPDGDAPPERWEDLVGMSADQGPDFILLADPFSSGADTLVMGLDYAFPRGVKIGGLASGANQPGGNALFLGDAVHNSGAVGLSVHGAITLDAVVAQGCRPIGETMRVTACNNNILLELDGHKPLEALGGVIGTLSERDRQLAQQSLFLGVLMDELNDSPVMGDFLIRNIIGVDNSSGVLGIGEMLEEGQIVQFHLRDAETSAQDLDAMLSRYAMEHPIYEDTGALLFSCLGRGSGLYGRADHDTDMFREKVNSMPLTGFFCNGEIGPVGDSTFLHGYTSSFGIFRARRE